MAVANVACSKLTEEFRETNYHSKYLQSTHETFFKIGHVSQATQQTTRKFSVNSAGIEFQFLRGGQLDKAPLYWIFLGHIVRAPLLSLDPIPNKPSAHRSLFRALFSEGTKSRINSSALFVPTLLSLDFILSSFSSVHKFVLQGSCGLLVLRALRVPSTRTHL